MSKPEGCHRVTVFIPAYNSARYLPQAIESVIAQTWRDFELLIVDDGSTDQTPAVLAEYAARDSRMRILRQPDNRGRPITRNLGLELARGEYIALMDADDYCEPERLAKQVAYLDMHSDIDVVGCLWSMTDDDGRVLDVTRPRRQLYSPEEIAAQMIFCCPVHQPTLMARTRVLARYRYDPDFPVAQDHELWSRMATAHRFAVLPERLIFYRQHEAQATTAQATDVQQARQRIQARQLAALGIEFDAQDLWKHDHLFHFKGRRLFRQQSGQELDLDFVRWARSWLEALVAANAVRRIYPEPTFSRIIGARWYFVCRKAAAGSAGVAVWREFARSSLKHVVVGAWWGRARSYFRGDDRMVSAAKAEGRAPNERWR